MRKATKKIRKRSRAVKISRLKLIGYLSSILVGCVGFFLWAFKIVPGVETKVSLIITVIIAYGLIWSPILIILGVTGIVEDQPTKGVRR